VCDIYLFIIFLTFGLMVRGS